VLGIKGLEEMKKSTPASVTLTDNITSVRIFSQVRYAHGSYRIQGLQGTKSFFQELKFPTI